MVVMVFYFDGIWQTQHFEPYEKSIQDIYSFENLLKILTANLHCFHCKFSMKSMAITTKKNRLGRNYRYIDKYRFLDNCMFYLGSLNFISTENRSFRENFRFYSWYICNMHDHWRFELQNLYTIVSMAFFYI